MRTLGYGSLTSLHADYTDSLAFIYPRVPDTVPVRSSEELAEGFLINTACSASYTDGPSSGETSAVVRLQIELAGVYEFHHGTLPFLRSDGVSPGWPRRVSTEPIRDPSAAGLLRPASCWASEPIRMHIAEAGEYEVEYTHGLDISFQAQLSATRIASECPPL